MKQYEELENEQSFIYVVCQYTDERKEIKPTQ